VGYPPPWPGTHRVAPRRPAPPRPARHDDADDRGGTGGRRARDDLRRRGGPMRIVQVANFYTPTSGGLKVVVEETGRRYEQAGHERILIVPGRTDTEERTPSGLRIVVRSLRVPGLGNYRILLNRRRVRRLLSERPPDVLEVSDKASMR